MTGRATADDMKAKTTRIVTRFYDNEGKRYNPELPKPAYVAVLVRLIRLPALHCRSTAE